MNYDGLMVASVVAELSKRLIGARIQDVRQHNVTDLTLEIRAPGRSYRLFFSVSAKFPRVYLTAVSKPVPGKPPSFCMVLRKHIEGARIVGVEQVRMDRIIVLRVSRAKSPPLCLTLEIMGKHSNLILVDADGKILGAAKNIGSSVSRVRQILPGRDYLLPPGSDKTDIRQLDRESFGSLWRDAPQKKSTRDWLVGTFSGFGPFLADEVVTRADPVTEESVWRELSSIAQAARLSAFSPVFVTTDRGQDLMVYPMDTAQYPASQQHSRASINDALDAFFRTAVTRSEMEDDRSQLLTAIRRAAAARRQTLKSAERTLEESENAERYRQVGEIILGSLHSIANGVASARVIDFYDVLMPEVEIDLDDKLTPQQNAERYFKRYQKARDSAAAATARREKALADLASLESASAEAGAAATARDVIDLRERLISEGLLRSVSAREQQAPFFQGRRIRRIEAPEGWEILYGETAQANDHLTQKIARPNDVWLHARAVTGAHVVVRTAGHGGNVPHHVLMQAATVAAANSQARHSSVVPVDHTLKKHVRKPRGSAPGFVTYSHEKTIDVSPGK